MTDYRKEAKSRLAHAYAKRPGYKGNAIAVERMDVDFPDSMYVVPMLAIADLLGETAAAGAGWQPIETAPKDGFVSTCRMGRPAHGMDLVCGYADPPEAAYYDFDFERWVPVQRPHDKWEPTHWMQIPKPPARDDLVQDKHFHGSF